MVAALSLSSPETACDSSHYWRGSMLRFLYPSFESAKGPGERLPPAALPKESVSTEWKIVTFGQSPCGIRASSNWSRSKETSASPSVPFLSQPWNSRQEAKTEILDNHFRQEGTRGRDLSEVCGSGADRTRVRVEATQDHHELPGCPMVTPSFAAPGSQNPRQQAKSARSPRKRPAPGSR